MDWNASNASVWHSPKKGDFNKIDEDIGKIQLSGKHYRKNGQMLRGLAADLLKIPKVLGLYDWLLGYRHVIQPTMIDMIGELRNEE